VNIITGATGGAAGPWYGTGEDGRVELQLDAAVNAAARTMLQDRPGITHVYMDTEFPFAACYALESHEGRFTDPASEWPGCPANERRLLSVAAVAMTFKDAADLFDEMDFEKLAEYSKGMTCFNGGLIAEEGEFAVYSFDKKNPGQKLKNADGTTKMRAPKQTILHYLQPAGAGDWYACARGGGACRRHRHILGLVW
jgi:hypothetical protein